MNLTLGDIAAHLQRKGLSARLDGDADTRILGIGSLADAQAGELSHLSNHRYAAQAAATAASALLLREDDRELYAGPAIVTANPYLAYAHASALFVSEQEAPAGVHSSAWVDPSVRIAPDASVGPGAVIGANSIIEAGVRVGANATIGADCVIGAHSRVYSGAILYDRVRLGERCRVHAGAVLGADGFGYTPDSNGHLVEIAQLGGVTLGNDVSIGAATTIDRGALGDTRIDDGVKIDNQVQIGHNCHIGAHTLICGCVGIVGSTTVGAHCVLAGGSGIGGDGPITVCDGVIVSAVTHIAQSIDTPGVYSGAVLAAPMRQWKRNALRFLRLDELVKRVTQLERRLDERK